LVEICPSLLETLLEEKVRDRKKKDGKRQGWGDWSQILHCTRGLRQGDILKVIYMNGTVLINNDYFLYCMDNKAACLALNDYGRRL
jgi:hypothetical protein